jgi:hypothetical protein
MLLISSPFRSLQELKTNTFDTTDPEHMIRTSAETPSNGLDQEECPLTYHRKLTPTLKSLLTVMQDLTQSR